MAFENKLYPPIIKGVLPAFYKEGNNITIKIPFSMNKMVSPNLVRSMYLRLKTVQTNIVKYCDKTINFDLENGIAIFNIENNDIIKGIIPGVFYKAQLAYCENSQPENVLEAGYFSTVGIIKCITKPVVKIANLSTSTANTFNNRFLGIYEQDPENGDLNEKVYSYCFTIEDKNNNIYITSGEQLHNINTDVNNWSSQDEFIVNKELLPNTIYYLKYLITTVNGLSISSPTYHIIADNSIEMDKTISILPKLNYDEGYIEIRFKGPVKDYIDPDTQVFHRIQEDNCTGLFLLSRASSQDDYMIWQDIAKFRLNEEKPSKYIKYDFTIEQGITYKYRLQQYNLSGIYSNPIYSKEVYADFEDMFLYDGIRQLKVRFDPKVSSFKVDIPEQKIETIGSKYPYIFRNGNVYYHEFPISGLISYQLDEAKLFLNEDEIINGEILDKNSSMRFIDTSNQYIKTHKNLTSDNLMSERYFKLKVLEWLTNGEVKLFRSPGEGNYLIRLLNTSMSPNDTLGRMLHTFSTTAYEIADLTYDNLLKYQLLSIGEPENSIINYSTIEFNENGVIYSNPEQPIYHFEVNDCTPGDQIIITYADGTKETITIGTTGSYNFTSIGEGVIQIEFISINGSPTYPHSITIETYDVQKTYFDFINNLSNDTIIAKTYYGPQENIMFDLNNNIGSLTNAYKTKVKNIEILNIWAREIIPIYKIQTGLEEKYATTPFGVGYPLRELIELKYKNESNEADEDMDIISRFAIFAIYSTDVIKDNAHRIDNENELDKHYNELYPDWEFVEYYDYFANNKFSLNELNTSFSIDSENYINLLEKRNITFYNLGPINKLFLGNGLIAEITARIESIDYTIEYTNSNVSQAKDRYLNAKNALINDYYDFINNNQEAWNKYYQYKNNIKTKEQLEEQKENLETSKEILDLMIMDNSALNNELLKASNIAIQNINKYLNDMINAWNNFRNNRPSSLNNINESPFEQLFTLIDSNQNFDEVKQNLIQFLQERNNYLNTLLNNFYNNIPQINNSNIDSLITNDLWEQDISDIVNTIINSEQNGILVLLNRLYNSLFKKNTNNLFQETFFENNNISTNSQWTIEDVDKIKNILNTISYSSGLTTQNIENEIQINNYNGELIDSWENYQQKLNQLQNTQEYYNEAKYNYEVANANFNEIQVVKDYITLVEQIQLLEDEIVELQKKIQAINSLLSSLENETSESNETAKQYLLSIRTTQENLISQKQEQIIAYQRRKEQLLPGYNEAQENLLNLKNIYEQAETNLISLQLEIDNSYTNFENKLNIRNYLLDLLYNYMNILTQVESLKTIANQSGDLQEQIDLYLQTYYQLINLNQTLYGIAYSNINQIEIIKQAFEELEILANKWEIDLNNVIEQIDNLDMTPYEKPDNFNLTTRVADIKQKWQQFLSQLKIAYRDIEERYLI